jgi:hypothetical protein
MIKCLKNKNIKDNKPQLILKSNHYEVRSQSVKIWAGHGTLIRDGFGGYKPQPVK